MARPRWMNRPAYELGLGFLAIYVLLDWISYIEPFAHFGITPWNPATGLSFVLVLLIGRKFVPLLFVAPMLADSAVRHMPFPWPVELLTTGLIGVVYGGALLVLKHPRLRFDPALQSLRSLLQLLATALVSSACVGAGYVGIVVLAGLLPSTDFIAAAARYWIGDLIGIAVLAPFALIILTRPSLPLRGWEVVMQSLVIVALVAMIFPLRTGDPLSVFYLLFLPMVWMAMRGGIEGVSIGIVLTQLAVIVGVKSHTAGRVDVTALQGHMLVLTLTGYIAGALVTERRHSEFQLRRHQDSLARLARVGSMGELAAAIAHEINQPLMAAGTYSRLVAESLRGGDIDREALAEMAGKAAAQVGRAAEVVRRLRALIRLDRTGRTAVSVAQIVNETLEICRPDLHRDHIEVVLHLSADLPLVHADLLQIEQVLLNLVRNGIEAIRTVRASGTIQIRAQRRDHDSIAIEVHDTGPGLPPDLIEETTLPFLTTKPDGLGVGLSLCRSIVESHGGRLELASDETGAIIRFTLPIAGRTTDV